MPLCWRPSPSRSRLRPFPRPQVILVIGVNGSGKTTTIAKLAHLFLEQDYGVMLAAGDTFRAAAIGQLKVWADRIGVPIVTGPEGGDAAGIVFDAVKRATAEGIDVLIVDTAGRLQNKRELMDELAKIRRVLGRLNPAAPHDVVLVLDATTGQNALIQIEIFKEVAGVTGLVMTKLDGSARGGILVAAAKQFGLPIHAIGVGETIDDLRPFNARDLARAISGGARMTERMQPVKKPIGRPHLRARFRAVAGIFPRHSRTSASSASDPTQGPHHSALASSWSRSDCRRSSPNGNSVGCRRCCGCPQCSW